MVRLNRYPKRYWTWRVSCFSKVFVQKKKTNSAGQMETEPKPKRLPFPSPPTCAQYRLHLFTACSKTNTSHELRVCDCKCNPNKIDFFFNLFNFPPYWFIYSCRGHRFAAEVEWPSLNLVEMFVDRCWTAEWKQISQQVLIVHGNSHSRWSWLRECRSAKLSSKQCKQTCDCYWEAWHGRE